MPIKTILKKPRFQTIEDFKTKDKFDNYIKSYITSAIFKKNSPQVIKEAERQYKYYRKIPNYIIRLYLADDTGVSYKIGFKFELPFTKYKLFNSSKKVYLENFYSINKVPFDIFLTLCGFNKIAICKTNTNTNTSPIFLMPGISSRHVLKAWILGIKNFRDFSRVSYPNNTFDEKLKRMNQEPVKKIKELNKKYHEIYKINKSWNLKLA